nr:potassium/proton antiporter [Propionibacterium sp.]
MSLDMLLFIGSGVLLIAVLAARMGAWIGLPSLLIFLAVGMGLELLGYRMDDAELAHALGFAALVFILGEGGFTTRWADIRQALTVAALLATVGVIASVAAVAAFCHLVLHFPLPAAVLMGAVIAPTDSAAVFSVLRTVPLPAQIRATLEGESGLNDAPIVLLVGVATEWSLGRLPEGGPAAVAGIILLELVGGLALGAVVGWLGAKLLKGVALPASGLYPLGAMGIVVLAYGLGVFVHVSGFAAVYVCAVILGNSDLPHRAATRSFAEGIGWVSQIGLFIMLGMLSRPQRLTLESIGVGLLIGAFVTFVARPLSVFLCASWVRMPWRAQLFVSWAGLRGAVPIIMATVPLAARAPEADALFDAVLVYVVVFTLLQAPSLPWTARLFGVTTGDDPIDIGVEAAPLDRIQADFMQVTVPVGSRLNGVTLQELRLPRLTVVATIIREGAALPVDGATRIRAGDELLIVTPSRERQKVEERFRRVSASGRLASWLDR